MNIHYFSFILPLLAGLATLIGYFFIYFPSRYQGAFIPFFLSLSAGVMISISLFSLIPEGISFTSTPFLFLLLGILFAYFIDLVLPKESHYSLYRVGIFSTIILILHNIPEGITTYLSTSYQLSFGLFLSLAIGFHNIPEGISVAVPIYYSTHSHLKAFFYTLMAGFSELFGAILASLFLPEFMASSFGFLFLLTAGIMLYISFFELFPNSFHYCHLKSTFWGFIVGFFLMIVCIFVFSI